MAMNVSLFLNALSTPISQIDDYIYLGNRQGAMDLSALRRFGITHVVQIQSSPTSPFLSGHFEYHCITIPDMPDQNMLRHLPAALRFIQAAISQQRKVFIHCDAGVSRSTTVTIAYYMAARRWTFNQALDFVRNKRGCAFPNEGFQRQLETLDASTLSSWVR